MLTYVNLSGQRFLEAARLVLKAEGMRAITMRAVAVSAGTTATAIYRHFADKGELLDALHRLVFDDFKSRISAVSPEMGAREALLMGRDIYCEFGLAQPAEFEFLFIEPHGIRTSRYPEDFKRVRSSTFAILVSCVNACQEKGLIAPGDPIEVALSLDAQALGLMMLYRSDRFGDNAESFRHFYHRTFERQIGG